MLWDLLAQRAGGEFACRVVRTCARKSQTCATSTRPSPTSSKCSLPIDDSLGPRGGSPLPLGAREISERRETGGEDEEKHVESAEAKKSQSAEGAGSGGLQCITPTLAPYTVDLRRAYNNIPRVRHSCESGAGAEVSGYCDDNGREGLDALLATFRADAPAGMGGRCIDHALLSASLSVERGAVLVGCAVDNMGTPAQIVSDHSPVELVYGVDSRVI